MFYVNDEDDMKMYMNEKKDLTCFYLITTLYKNSAPSAFTYGIG